jgi:tetratricopeptide (TPR) repeat protein
MQPHLFFLMRLLLLLLLFQHPYKGHAQSPKIDSLSKLLLIETTDSNRVSLLWQLAEQYQPIKPDTALQLAQRGLLLAQRINFAEGESRSLAMLATSQYLLGNYPNALNNYMLKLKLEEKRNSPRNYASALSNIGLMYILLGEYQNALGYLHRADSTVEAAGGQAKSDLKYSITINTGEAWYRMKMADSAYWYFKKALTIAQQSGDPFSLGVAVLGEANVLALKEDNKPALQNYYSAFKYLNDGLNNEMLCEVTLGMAKLYEKLNNVDSAAYYGTRSFDLAEKGRFMSRQLDAANFLSGHFKKLQLYQPAFTYAEQAGVLKDSIEGQEKTRQSLIISNNEQLRQAELAEQKLREKETRSQQLQLLVIAVCIPLLFLFTLFISRIKIHPAIIKFMGIISLLSVFEFLTLLLHPLVADFTHHVPVLELLLFVIIAAGIIPLHHKLEHLLIEKLTKGKYEGSGHRIKIKTIRFKIKK